MSSIHQKWHIPFLVVLFLTIFSCKATEVINSTPPLPNPSIKCDTCPEILPPPPPPPLPECPPPPPPPLPECPPPPPPPTGPPCLSCMSQQPQSPSPQPPKYYNVNTPGSNLYVTGYTYSGGTRVKSVMSGFVMFGIVALLEVIMLT